MAGNTAAPANASSSRPSRSPSASASTTPTTPPSAIAGRVPDDNEQTTSFGVNFTHMPPDAREGYLAKRRAHAEELAKLPPYTEVAEAVLRGELRIEDIADRHRFPDRLFNIQDYVSQ